MVVAMVVVLLTIILILFIILKAKQHSNSRNLPPCPPSLPVLGHLHLLSLPLHRALLRLSLRWGPDALLLHFGSRPVLVVSSPSAVEECFTRNDIVFANRPRFPHAKSISYNHTALAAASYGPALRNLRRIAALEIFSPAKIRALCPLLNEEVRLMLTELAKDSKSNYTKVDMHVKFTELMFNIIMKLITGKREISKRFRDMIEEMFAALDATNPEDFIPILKFFKFKGLESRMARLGKEMDELFQEMIEERRRERREENRTVVDVLLSLQESDAENYSDELIKGMILTLIAAGTHTTSTAMEWALSLLLNHPESLHKLQTQIDNQTDHSHLINPLDIQNLSYLNNVIKETLRLYPVVPLLLPHESSAECTVSGFNISRNTMLFVNVYAIHRDPTIWDKPEEFKPERFEERGVSGSKTYFPFGLGRRSCPGEGLAMTVLGLVLGGLVQCFEWERIGGQEVDMSEGSGIAMPKAKHLEAMYSPRRIMVDVLSSL